MNSLERSQLIDALIDGEISEADFLRLEAEFSVDPAARREYYNRLALAALLEIEAGSGADSARKIVALSAPVRRWLPTFAAIAATIVALAAVTALLLKNERVRQTAAAQVETKASGFGVIAGQANAVWKNAPLADGALVPAGPLRLASGIAQIELFSGVTAVVEGEAEFEVVSPMELAVTRGKVRAHVPEAAHGFRIRTAEGQVVDLGTEFAVDVSESRSDIHVIEGKVEWHPQQQAMQLMNKGDALRWADGSGAKHAASAQSFVGVAELAARRDSVRDARREEWQRYTETLRRDPRLLAYYKMNGGESWSRLLPNFAEAGADRVGQGAIVAASRTRDRWDAAGGALDFSPAGSRVRVHVPGELGSLTMLCWVKINSLDRLYNSLFLTDGHEVGAPHWQITRDGRLFFSVKKSERHDPASKLRDKYDFFSPPFWNASLSGQWAMLAVTYDVAARRVTHYVNGQPIGSQAVPAEYLVESVKIGNASIGNWSEPVYRTDPRFTVRNLNGSVDEFAIFTAALSPEEIADIYVHGKP